ncbi:hypothetical protein DPMN_083566 [Dreissena polymorpha]|uniref:Uncharacterized protein n=1 Tax=Dreissena polymorpha TaxID=45954 RepID=A0A9D3Y904_DREPO|nr:hypothetical protein DPMN_083566 [Dreissena polymorpha]
MQVVLVGEKMSSAYSCSSVTQMTTLIQSSHKYDSLQTIAFCTGPCETFKTKWPSKTT